MTLRWFWSCLAAFLTLICSAVMALSIMNFEQDARLAGHNKQIQLTTSILSMTLKMPMMADSRVEVDTLLEEFVDISPDTTIYLRWANGKHEQFGAGEIPDAISSLSGMHAQAAPVKGQQYWYVQSIDFKKIYLGTIALYLPPPVHDIYNGKVKFLLVMIVLLLALLGGGLAYHFTGGLSKWVRMVSKISKQVGAGDFSVHIPHYGKGETAQASEDFNQMISRLVQRQTTLRLFGHYQNPQQVSDSFDRALINTNCPSKTVAVMAVEMVDFVGYISTTRKSGGLLRLNRFLGILEKIISEHGGHLIHLSGGRLIAVFNHPLNLKNYQDKAALASLAIVEVSKTQPLQQPGGDTVEFTVGLVQGEVLMGYLGTGRHRAFRVIGAPVSLAESLAMLGGGHEVIAGGDILQQLGYGFGQNNLGIQTLAGGQNLHVASILPESKSLIMQVNKCASAVINDGG